MARGTFDSPTNPYHYALRCIGGKWKMTILHEIYTFGEIHFNKTLRVIPVSEKVLSQQLKELAQDGLIARVVDNSVYPPSIKYELTEDGLKIMPALDMLYIWSIRQMDAKNIPIDADAFVVHQSEKYVDALKDIMDANGFWLPSERKGSK